MSLGRLGQTDSLWIKGLSDGKGLVCLHLKLEIGCGLRPSEAMEHGGGPKLAKKMDSTF